NEMASTMPTSVIRYCRSQAGRFVAATLKQLLDSIPLCQQVIRSPLPVAGFEVFDPHRVIVGLRDVRRRERFVTRILAASVTSAVNLPATNSTTSEHIRQAMSPMVATS